VAAPDAPSDRSSTADVSRHAVDHGRAADTGGSPAQPGDARYDTPGGGGVASADDPKGAPADEVVEADVPPRPDTPAGADPA
jgi:hypothetical protein